MSLSVMVLSACGSNTLQTSDKGGAKIGDPNQKICTQIAVSALGISVNVPSGWDPTALASAVKIEVTDDNGPVDMMELEPEGNTLRMNGAYENFGPFKVKVTLGSVSASTNVTVENDGCHPKGSNVTVDFQPPNKIVLSAAASY